VRSIPTEEDERMAQDFKRGDRVEWNFRGAKVVGTVRRRLTSRTIVNNRVVAASKDDPRYLVRSETSGKEAARRGKALRRRP
jgi:Hypervirulence associated proteins TUDOR domain